MTAFRETRDDLKDHIAMWLSGQGIEGGGTSGG
jgi:hypothetical protein